MIYILAFNFQKNNKYIKIKKYYYFIYKNKNKTNILDIKIRKKNQDKFKQFTNSYLSIIKYANYYVQLK